MGSMRRLAVLSLLCLVGAALIGSASAVPKHLEPQHGDQDVVVELKRELSQHSDYWKSLSEEDVENALADDDGFDTQLFSTILDAIQQDKLKGQAAFEAAARHAFEDGLVRHGRKINGQGIRSVLPSTDAEAAMIARSSGGLHPESSQDSGDAVKVQMRVVVGQLRMEMPWLHCLWNHVRHAVSSLWGRRGTEPVAGPRRHSVAKRHAAVASPSAPQDQIDEQLDMLKRSGFADEGDALFDLLQHFDSGDGESEELLPQHTDDQNVHQFNRKVKISVVRIPPREAGSASQWAHRLRQSAGSGCAPLLTGILILVFVVSGTVLILSALQTDDPQQCDSCRHLASEPEESDIESDSEVEIKRVVTYTLHQ